MMPPECTALNNYRLQKDWTWDALSAAMKRIDIEMSPRTLHYLLTPGAAPVNAKPLDRTLFKIRRFLEHARAVEKRRRRARRRAHKLTPATTSGASA